MENCLGVGLYRPLLVYTNDNPCYAIIIGGAGLDGEDR